MTCQQSGSADAAQAHAPRSVWSLVFDAFRHRNHPGGGRSPGASSPPERMGVALVELDHARYLEQHPPSES